MKTLPLKTNSGFLLVEAIISITILVMVAATSISLLVMGHRAVNVNEHSLEASWLAQEGAESLRGIRDTNWIRFGFDKENCWNSTGTCDPPLSVPSFTGTVGASGYYALETSLTGAPELTQVSGSLDMDAGEDAEVNQEYLLYYQDIDGTNDKQYIGPSSAGYTVIEPTKYFRQVETTLIDDGSGGTYIDAMVTVGWYEGSKPHAIKLPVTLTNYQLEE